MKTPEEILESNFYKPKETLQHYDNIVTCIEDYHSQFKFYTVKQMEELREHAYQLGIQHERDTMINIERDRMIHLLDYLQATGTWNFGDTGKVVDQYIDSLCEMCEGEGYVYRDRITNVKVECDCKIRKYEYKS